MFVTSFSCGSTTSDRSQSFKLSDSDINTLVTEVYRGHGTASSCYGGACSVDTTLFWSSSCTYASGSTSTGACADAYDDVSLTSARGYNSPCSWIYGLTSTVCDSIAEMGTSDRGDHVFVGDYDSFLHAYDGRSGEDPDLQVWVR